ncbi:alkylation response protein AidB-like acyl-CoA dehydrogenase [Nocardia transvalensis]|uniref:Alkylation response protein AidB-like acyl-CoA dehydrogenase n=1 Tax=Nocardia transvalensis TaxID=37333 RepID=A0A7W9PHC4_9NOCA|nr:acyl-CoA dehydrogenase [Nocardia transvalensis]MBB5916092.1 alkylation response protein AidB-like acyl-CoA dehydrogenase [Nocardia transvalensis]
MSTVETVVTPVPRPGAAELTELVADIAADAARRRAAGDTEPPEAAVAAVKRLRLGAARVPVADGGGGWTVGELFAFLIDLAEADPDVPHILRVHFGFVEELYRLPRTDDKSAWIAEVAAGRLIGGALTELGANPVGDYVYDSTLTAAPGGYRLNGRKFYSTGARYGDYVRVTAKAPEGGVLSAIVPVDRAGVEHVDDWDGIGQRHTSSGTTIFTDVAVAPEETLPFRDPRAADRPRQAFPQLYLHALAAGILRSVVTDAADVVRSRARNFVFANTGEPRHDPQLLAVVGELDAAAFAAEAVVLAAAAAQDRSFAAARSTGVDPALESDSSVRAAQAKVAIEDFALRAAGRIFDVGGASATRGTAGLDRHWRNLRTLFSHNPAAYKARSLGNLRVNDEPLPLAGHF